MQLSAIGRAQPDERSARGARVVSRTKCMLLFVYGSTSIFLRGTWTYHQAPLLIRSPVRNDRKSCYELEHASMFRRSRLDSPLATSCHGCMREHPNLNAAATWKPWGLQRTASLLTTALMVDVTSAPSSNGAVLMNAFYHESCCSGHLVGDPTRRWQRFSMEGVFPRAQSTPSMLNHIATISVTRHFLEEEVDHV